jgi:hypothetical protein
MQKYLAKKGGVHIEPIAPLLRYDVTLPNCAMGSCLRRNDVNEGIELLIHDFEAFLYATVSGTGADTKQHSPHIKATHTRYTHALY